LNLNFCFDCCLVFYLDLVFYGSLLGSLVNYLLIHPLCGAPVLFLFVERHYYFAQPEYFVYKGLGFFLA